MILLLFEFAVERMLMNTNEYINSKTVLQVFQVSVYMGKAAIMNTGEDSVLQQFLKSL